ncbi:tyrosine-type recombinase/integrase [Cryptosporangium aurantiacum]|uniref:Site-specific recombinase XerD n=1 Tax=Cryptosporangium aurantiacum TaxID=134849 RepID=A0A1M7RED1_9ACTN|nr:tyrosine-type recombinase/integrase [Cryptosporangium aurantiacum]SHN44635.1 Site-specific recombinase XerD [Cryptosporangium aurantiacum]
MTGQGVVFKYCTCDEGRVGQRRSRRCPRLAERGHGLWAFDTRMPDLTGRRRQVRRSGFRSKSAACRVRDELLAQTPELRAGAVWTLEQWLKHWISTRTSIRPTTARSYQSHITLYLLPHLGHYRLGQVTARQLTEAFAVLAQQHNRYGEPLAGSTLHRVKATLRAAFNAAIREGLVTDNPARRIELAPARRPHAVVWTEPRVQTWRRTGEREPVTVWTAEQLATFLQNTNTDRLHALWHLIALRGLRRGEAAGLRWCDVDLDTRQLVISQQRVEVTGAILVGPPKSAASRRTVALDPHTVAVLRAHAQRQRFERRAADEDWTDTGYVFTKIDGLPLRPSYVTNRFRLLRRNLGLPPVRLHDLRHGAASLAHCAGADLKLIQDQLGHASIVLTADTYTTVLPPAQHNAAAATAALVLDAARRVRGDITRKSRAERRRANRITARRKPCLINLNPQVSGLALNLSKQATSRRGRATGEQPLSA